MAADGSEPPLRRRCPRHGQFAAARHTSCLPLALSSAPGKASMYIRHRATMPVACALLLVLAATAWSQKAPAEKALIDFSVDADLARVTSDRPDQVSVAPVKDPPSVVVTCRPKRGLPRHRDRPAASYGTCPPSPRRSTTNTGTARSCVTLRVDNAAIDHESRNGEALWLAPGETGTIRVRFGYSWGRRLLDPQGQPGAGLHQQPRRRPSASSRLPPAGRESCPTMARGLPQPKLTRLHHPRPARPGLRRPSQGPAESCGHLPSGQQRLPRHRGQA